MAIILSSNDAKNTTQNTDPLSGGDAIALQALSNIPKTYLGIISAGLDIKISAFKNNIQYLKSKGIYLGARNLNYNRQKFPLILPLITTPTITANQYKLALHDYRQLCKHILVLDPKDINQPDKWPSLTATVTYHAITYPKYIHNIIHTYVPWELATGIKVNPQHSIMYFFKANKLYAIKKHYK